MGTRQGKGSAPSAPGDRPGLTLADLREVDYSALSAKEREELAEVLADLLPALEGGGLDADIPLGNWNAEPAEPRKPFVPRMDTVAGCRRAAARITRQAIRGEIEPEEANRLTRCVSRVAWMIQSGGGPTKRKKRKPGPVQAVGAE